MQSQKSSQKKSNKENTFFNYKFFFFSFFLHFENAILRSSNHLLTLKRQRSNIKNILKGSEIGYGPKKNSVKTTSPSCLYFIFACNRCTKRGGLHLFFGHHKQWGPLTTTEGNLHRGLYHSLELFFFVFNPRSNLDINFSFLFHPFDDELFLTLLRQCFQYKHAYD
jgi:hypothetical protein